MAKKEKQNQQAEQLTPISADQEETVVLPEPNQTERVTKGGWEGDVQDHNIYTRMTNKKKPFCT